MCELTQGSRQPANDKAHIPLTKCFALSDFGWGSLSPARSVLSARGARRVYMIKKIERQAASSKQQATLDSWYKII